MRASGEPPITLRSRLNDCILLVLCVFLVVSEVMGSERKDTNPPKKPLALPRNFAIKRVCMRVCVLGRRSTIKCVVRVFPLQLPTFRVVCITVSFP